MFTKLFNFFLLIIFIPFFSTYSEVKQKETLIIFKDSNYNEMKNVMNYIETNGGRNIHIYPPSVLISILPENFEFKQEQNQSIKIITSSIVDANKYSEMGVDVEYAIEAWNNNFKGLSKSKGLDTPPSSNASALVNDAIMEKKDQVPHIPIEKKPHGAGFYDTSEFLLGDISVAVIFVESNGSIDPQSENWTYSRESQCVSEIQNGLNWVSVQNPDADLSFTYHFYYGRTNASAQTGYEPIERYNYEDDLWQNEIMGKFGYSGTNVYRQHDFLNDLIEVDDTHWGVLVWVVDSYNDIDGFFQDSSGFAYAAVGGPYIVMTYDNDGWLISNMDAVIAHEIQHSFYAMDEYEEAGVPCTAHRGYLDVENQNSEYGSCLSNVNCIMRSEYLSGTQVCDYSEGQVGWYDNDSDGIPNILDTEPITDLDPVPTGTIYYKLLPGNVNLNPLNNLNPFGSHNDITINTAGVEYNINGLGWYNDGIILNDNNDFVIGPFADGNHTVQVRATNSVGNVDGTPESFTRTFETKLKSLSSTALSTGGSRKIWSTEYWDPEENPVGQRVVYEDNGDIYYTEYRYQNISGPYYYWTDEELISDGSGNSKYPSLAVAQQGEYCIVWQQYDVATGKYKIIYREFNTGNPTTPHILTDQSTSNISRPVVSVTSGTMGFSYGRYWHFLWDNGNGLKFAENEYEIYDVPGTNSSSHNPTITNDPNIYNGIVAYAWEQSGNIYFQKLNFQGVPVNYPVENLTGAYSSIESCSDPSIALMGGDIMIAFHAKTLYMPISKTFVKPPPPQLYDEIYARRHDGNNWGTLNTLFIANTEGQTPAVGSVNYDDFSVMWKVKNQNLLAKLDYVGGTGWDLYSTVETYTANNIKNPTLSTASSDISALWSEGTSPFSVHHEELVNPSKRKIEKLTNEKGHSANNRIYRKAEIDFSKMNSEAEGYLTLRMSETTDENNTPFLLFRNDSLTAGSFLSSPYFAPTPSNTVLKLNIQLFGARLNLPANLINTNQTLFRISVLGEKTNYPLQIIKEFSLKNIKPDSAGIYYFDKTFAINTANFMGRQIRIDIELLPGNWTTYQPLFIEEFELDGGGAKLIASEQNDTSELDKSDAAESLLLQAWPNPFNPVTNITFVLSKPSNISLKIYDIRGRVVANLFEGRKDAGKYTIKFDGSNLSSGVYFYEMINENQKEIRKIMLIK